MSLALVRDLCSWHQALESVLRFDTSSSDPKSSSDSVRLQLRWPGEEELGDEDANDDDAESTEKKVRRRRLCRLSSIIPSPVLASLRVVLRVDDALPQNDEDHTIRSSSSSSSSSSSFSSSSLSSVADSKRRNPRGSMQGPRLCLDWTDERTGTSVDRWFAPRNCPTVLSIAPAAAATENQSGGGASSSSSSSSLSSSPAHLSHCCGGIVATGLSPGRTHHPLQVCRPLWQPPEQPFGHR